jgi:YNFM family putative membrane transporter
MEDGAHHSTSRWILPGTPAYRRVGLGLFLAGFATFSLLYCVQPLLPVFAAYFHVGPTESSLALSLSTALLAFAILCAAVLSEGAGRRGLMLVSMAAASICNIACAFVPNWTTLLALRAAEGFLLGGVPAVAMAYLAEEIDPRGLGLAMGLLIGGNAFGGMTGRVLTGFITESASWQTALLVLGLLGLLSTAGFILLLPPSHNFRPRPGFEPAYHWRAWRGHLADRALLPLFAVPFLASGSFVAIYNYAGFRLSQPPFDLNQRQIGLIFTVYLFGIAASSLGGALADRHGRQLVLPASILITMAGVLITLASGLAGIILGIVVVTTGFFATQSIASGWVGRLAQGTKGHASSLYLLAYYLGSSLIGSAGGWFWSKGAWPAVALFTLALYGLALATALRVNRVVRGGGRG